mgnify:CR=1 FL=1
MDQDAFRKTYREVNECFCAYEKSILTSRCGCSFCSIFCIAEREGVECQSPEAQKQCFNLLEFLKENARFVLKIHHEGNTLPHGKAIRLQVGGLRGLHALLYPDEVVPAVIQDAHVVIEGCKEKYGGIDKIPFQEVIKQIALFQEKKRSKRGREPSNDD